MLRLKHIFFVLIVLSLNLYSQSTLDGHWEGAIVVYGSELGMKLNFKTDPDSSRGTIDIPQQKAKDLPLIHVTLKKDIVHFELPAGPGVAIFDGKMISDSAGGSFTQAGITGTFWMKKGEAKTDSSGAEINPYNIPDAPFKQEEVSFTNGENTFAGTLTVPEKEGKHPAVVLITGSGPQNRDEEIMGFKPFRLIADYLTRRGIAVLRYDDRGVGGSTGKKVSESTTDDFAGDVIEAVKYLKTRSDINPDQIGLIGHSEGGVIAPLVASKYDGVAFIVLMAGTGVKGIDILKEQSKLLMEAESSRPDEIDGYQEMLDEVYKASQTGKGWDDIKKGFRKAMEQNYDQMSDKEKKSVPDKEAYIKTMTETTVAQFNSPWMKYFMSYDPAPALTKTKCPVLLLFGDKDLQVPPKQNEKPMTDALTKGGNKDFEVKKFHDCNHLFKRAIIGAPSEYANPPQDFVPGFLDAVGDWIAKRVSIVN